MARHMVTVAVAMALSGSPAISVEIGAQPASVKGRTQSCTAQWLAKRQQMPLKDRYNNALADVFGKRCLRATPLPIDWAQTRRDLATLIAADHRLADTVPADIDTFCPGYRRAGRAARADVWRVLAYEVIKPEAGRNAHAVMWEQPYRNHQPVAGGEYSIGLLQLSLSNRGPYQCDIPDEASLLDPHRNLACGVRIVDRLISRDGRIGGDETHGKTGLGRYWSTIRVIAQKPARSRGRETRQPIIDAVRRLPQCGAS